MEAGQFQHEPEQRSRLFQVTPLSKYLAMLLFVILPFLGGYVGYTFAPEKVVEVEKVARGTIEQVEESQKSVAETDTDNEPKKYVPFLLNGLTEPYQDEFSEPQKSTFTWNHPNEKGAEWPWEAMTIDGYVVESSAEDIDIYGEIFTELEFTHFFEQSSENAADGPNSGQVGFVSTHNNTVCLVEYADSGEFSVRISCGVL